MIGLVTGNGPGAAVPKKVYQWVWLQDVVIRVPKGPYESESLWVHKSKSTRELNMNMSCYTEYQKESA